MLQKYIILLFAIIAYPDDRSSSDIQKEIDSRTTQIELLKKEIEKLENNIITKTQNEINVSEILLDLENKIDLTEKLIKSINREEKRLLRQIDKTYIEIQEIMENDNGGIIDKIKDWFTEEENNNY